MRIKMGLLAMPIANNKILLSKKFDYLDQYNYIDDDVFLSVQRKYVNPIGHFMIDFSDLENSLDEAIAKIIHDRTDELGYAVIEGLSVYNKISLFSSLYLRLESTKPKGNSKKIKTLKDELLRLNTFRNYIAHANWQTLDLQGYVRTKIVTDSEEGYIKFEKVQLTPDNIKSNTRDINRLSRSLFKYVDSAFNF